MRMPITRIAWHLGVAKKKQTKQKKIQVDNIFMINSNVELYCKEAASTYWNDAKPRATLHPTPHWSDNIAKCKYFTLGCTFCQLFILSQFRCIPEISLQNPCWKANISLWLVNIVGRLCWPMYENMYDMILLQNGLLWFEKLLSILILCNWYKLSFVHFSYSRKQPTSCSM